MAILCNPTDIIDALKRDLAAANGDTLFNGLTEFTEGAAAVLSVGVMTNDDPTEEEAELVSKLEDGDDAAAAELIGLWYPGVPVGEVKLNSFDSFTLDVMLLFNTFGDAAKFALAYDGVGSADIESLADNGSDTFSLLVEDNFDLFNGYMNGRSEG